MTWVGGLLIAGNADLNPAEGLNVCLLCLLCVVQVVTSATWWSLVHRSPTGPIWALHQRKKEVREEFAGQMKRNFLRQ
jgi:hypothetical protein